MLKFLLNIVSSVLLIIAVICVLFVASGNGHIPNGVSKTYLIGELRPDIDDMHFFDLRKIEANHNSKPLSWSNELEELTQEQLRWCDSLETTAFVVLRQGNLIAEHYWEGYGPETYSNSFSMAKSFLSLCIGHALMTGEIKSMDEPIMNYIPTLNIRLDQHVTIRRLLQMSSGIDFGESYFDPFGYQAKAYYGTELEENTLTYHATKTPGEHWSYEGGNSVLLGLALRSATGMTVSEYFSEHFWQKIGAEHDAYWNLDHADGMEKSFSGVYSTPHDFARIGQFLLDSCTVKGEHLLSPAFFEEMTTPIMLPDSQGEPTDHYGLHLWLGEKDGSPIYSCRGMRGQYIIILPEEEAVVVRLGHARIESTEDASPDFWQFVRFAEELIEKHEGRH